jgi:hypothetical protein
MEVSGYLHVPLAYPLRRDFGFHWIENWLNPSAGWCMVLKINLPDFLLLSKLQLSSP